MLHVNQPSTRPKALNSANFFTETSHDKPPMAKVHAALDKNKLPSKARFSPPLIDTFKAREIQKKFEMAFLEQNRQQEHTI